MSKNIKLEKAIQTPLVHEEWRKLVNLAKSNPDNSQRKEILRLLKRLYKTSKTDWDSLSIGEKTFLRVYLDPRILNEKSIEELALPLFTSFTGRKLSAVKAAVDQVALGYNITKSKGNGLMSTPRILMLLEKINNNDYQKLVDHFSSQRNAIIAAQGGKPVLQVFTDVDDTCYQSKLGGCDMSYHDRADKTLYDDWTVLHKLIRDDEIANLFGCSRTENTLTLISALPMTPLKPYASTMKDIYNKAKDQAFSLVIESPVKDISEIRAIPPPYGITDIFRLKGSFPKILKFMLKRLILSSPLLRLCYFAIAKSHHIIKRTDEYFPSFYQWINAVGEDSVWEEFFNGKNQVLKACAEAYPEKEFLFFGDCGQADHRVGEELLKIRPNSKVFIHNIQYNCHLSGQPQGYHWSETKKSTMHRATDIYTFDTYKDLIGHIESLRKPNASEPSSCLQPLSTVARVHERGGIGRSNFINPRVTSNDTNGTSFRPDLK